MRVFFKIGPGFENVPKFDEPVLEGDVKEFLSARERAEYARPVIHMAPVAVVDDFFSEGGGEGEMGLPDAESEGYASRKDHERDREGRPGTGDPWRFR
jgi:hypothetical protein